MEIQQYISQLKEVYESFLEYIEDFDGDVDNEKFQNFTQLLSKYKIQNNREELLNLLKMISKIVDNYHHYPNFYKKIDQVLSYLKGDIKQSLTNHEIFITFLNNKRVLLFLFKNNLIIPDKFIAQNFTDYTYLDQFLVKYDYHLYFYPEIKDYLDEAQRNSIEKELFQIDANIFDNFDEKRLEGENDSVLCEMIRNDSVESFIQYINKECINLKSSIKQSIFETNLFLLKQDAISLIEYAAFFGSILIFQYIKNSHIELRPSLWFYSIHGKNSEIISTLESCKIEVPQKNDPNEMLYFEAIQCHHNEIAEYIECNFVDKASSDIFDVKRRIFKNVYDVAYSCYNYKYITVDIDDKFSFIYICKYDHITLANLYLKHKEIDINEEIRTNESSSSFLSIAAENNSFEIVKLLISHKADIDELSFRNCYLLTEFEIPSYATKIRNCMFERCTSLTKVTIPSSVKSIGYYAFYNCHSLQSIEIPSSVTEISKSAFACCSSLIEVTIPSSVESLKGEAFSKCKSLKRITFDGPSSLEEIGESMFSKCTSLTEIEIPSKVTKIKRCAFEDCTSLTRISIPSNVTEIEEHAFENCTSLTRISIPSDVTYIGYHAFKNCSSLVDFEFQTNLSLPNKLKCISHDCFNGCTSINRIKIPSSVIGIAQCAFYKCSSLEEVTFDDNSKLTIIDKDAFHECKSLKKIELPNSISTIGPYAFYRCESLTHLVIPSSVTLIDEYAFYGCFSLLEIDVPNSVTEIKKDAFHSCTSLVKVLLPSSIDVICEYTFKNCTALKQINIPSSVTCIEYRAFFNCSSLDNISIPPSVEVVQNEAFKNCSSLVHVSVPLSTKFSDNVFPSTTNVTKI